MSNSSSAANLPSTEVEMLNTWQRVLSSSFVMASLPQRRSQKELIAWVMGESGEGYLKRTAQL